MFLACSAEVGERVSVISTIAQVAHSIRDLANQQRAGFDTKWLSSLHNNISMAFSAQTLLRLMRDAQYDVLEVDNRLVQGHGKPDKKKQRVDSNSKIAVPKVLKPNMTAHKQLMVLQVSYLNV